MKTPANADITIIGAGSYGTALAICFARNGNNTVLWGRDPEHMAAMAESRSNERYLPGNAFPESLALETDLQLAIQASDIVLVVVPSHVFGDMLKQIKPSLSEHSKLAWATKGLDPKSGQAIARSGNRYSWQ